MKTEIRNPKSEIRNPKSEISGGWWLRDNPVLRLEMKRFVRVKKGKDKPEKREVALWGVLILAANLFITAYAFASPLYVAFDFTKVLTFIILGLTVIVVPAVLSTTFTMERERQTMEVLIMTPLPPIAILLGKFLPALLRAGIIVGCFLPGLFASLLAARPSFGVIVHLFFILLSCLCLVSVISLWTSFLCRRTWVSVTAAYAVLLVFFLLSFAIEQLLNFAPLIVRSFSILSPLAQAHLHASDYIHTIQLANPFWLAFTLQPIGRMAVAEPRALWFGYLFDIGLSLLLLFLLTRRRVFEGLLLR